MRTSLKIGVAAVAAGAMFTAGIAVTAASPSPKHPKPAAGNRADSQARAAAAAPVDTTTESKFTPITPCRVVNTKLTTKIAANQIRNYKVVGTNLSSQGGSSTGCGIPAGATGVAASVLALDGTGNGSLRFSGFGQTPANSLMTFTKGSSSGAPVLALKSDGFSVQALNYAVNIAVTITGYYVKPMYAHVNSDGSLVKGSRVTASSVVETTAYEIEFDRDVSNCSYSVTAFFVSYTAGAEPRGGNVKAVFVYFESGNATIKTNFYLTVTC